VFFPFFSGPNKKENNERKQKTKQFDFQLLKTEAIFIGDNFMRRMEKILDPAASICFSSLSFTFSQIFFHFHFIFFYLEEKKKKKKKKEDDRFVRNP
jgi:hypothetical protein